jgi:hypothetical protein
MPISVAVCLMPILPFDVSRILETWKFGTYQKVQTLIRTLK